MTDSVRNKTKESEPCRNLYNQQLATVGGLTSFWNRRPNCLKDTGHPETQEPTVHSLQHPLDISNHHLLSTQASSQAAHSLTSLIIMDPKDHHEHHLKLL